MSTAPFLGAYQGRRVLVTGHTGFKGAWLCFWLARLGAEVTGLALDPPTQPSLFERTGLAGRIRHIRCDVRDLDGVLAAFGRARPDMVFHLAAQSLVRHSYAEPKETFDTNIGGTVNVLEAVRTSDTARVLVVVSSDKCYENREWPWGYRENDRLGGRDPYSASKGALEIVFASYLRSFFPTGSGTGAASARAGNVLGGGDWATDRLVPDLCRALEAGQALEVRHPEALRPWQFVLEPLAGYLHLGALLERDPDAFSGAWNFAPLSMGTTVRELVESFLARWGQGEWRDGSAGQSQAPAEATLLRLCSDKARSLMGWFACLEHDETVASTVDGYRAFSSLDPTGLWHYYQDQIAAYEKLAAERGPAWAGPETDGSGR